MLKLKPFLFLPIHEKSRFPFCYSRKHKIHSRLVLVSKTAGPVPLFLFSKKIHSHVVLFSKKNNFFFSSSRKKKCFPFKGWSDVEEHMGPISCTLSYYVFFFYVLLVFIFFSTFTYLFFIFTFLFSYYSY